MAGSRLLSFMRKAEETNGEGRHAVSVADQISEIKASNARKGYGMQQGAALEEPDHLGHLRIADVMQPHSDSAPNEIATTEKVRVNKIMIEAMSLAYVAGHDAELQSVNFRAGGAIAPGCAVVGIDGSACTVRLGGMALNSFEATDLAHYLLAAADAIRKVAKRNQPGSIV